MVPQAWTNNFENARHRVDALAKQEAFRHAIETCQADKRSGGLDPQNWLMRPVQHVIRQRLLLDEILKQTDEAHPDIGVLRSAAEAIQAEVTRVNEQKRQYERQQEWRDVHGRLRGEFTQAARPHRQLLRKGGMQEIRRAAPQLAKPARGPSAEVLLFRGMSLRGRLDRGVSLISTRATHFVFLCDDSLWYADVLRGNRYKVVHVFQFGVGASRSAMSCTSQKNPSAAHRSTTEEEGDAAGIRLRVTAPDAFEVSDAHMTVELRPQVSNERETAEEATKACVREIE
jgi:hypothetical protein